MYFFHKFPGPANWANFSSTCDGSKQSPIDIDRLRLYKNMSLGAFTVKGYDTSPNQTWRISNNGYTIVLTLSSELNVSGAGLPVTYKAAQLHFHWGNLTTNGSEHTLDSKRYSMEMHIVHIKSTHANISSALGDPEGLSVFGFFMQVSGTNNTNYDTIINAIRKIPHKVQFNSSIFPLVSTGDSYNLPSTFPLESLLAPGEKYNRYYRYVGSLTTPPCNQSVIWTMFEEPINISQTQYNFFVNNIYSTPAEVSQHDKLIENFRPIQAVNSRRVYASKDATVLSCASIPVLSLILSVLQLLSMKLVL
ncbi:CAH15 anhydrase, partial [Amia calva]|nr:CAH15 anhydrase [Amia calva]